MLVKLNLELCLHCTSENFVEVARLGLGWFMDQKQFAGTSTLKWGETLKS